MKHVEVVFWSVCWLDAFTERCIFIGTLVCAYVSAPPAPLSVDDDQVGVWTNNQNLHKILRTLYLKVLKIYMREHLKVQCWPPVRRIVACRWSVSHKINVLVLCSWRSLRRIRYSFRRECFKYSLVFVRVSVSTDGIASAWHACTCSWTTIYTDSCTCQADLLFPEGSSGRSCEKLGLVGPPPYVVLCTSFYITYISDAVLLHG